MTYIIYDKISGSPARDFDALGTEPKNRLIETYAKQCVKLYDVQFDRIGSLDADQSGRVFVGTTVDLRDITRPETPYFGGPFQSMRDLYLYQIDQVLNSIKAGTSFRQGPTLGYLIHLELRDLVTHTEALDEDETEFYLQHPDSHAENLLIADDGELRCLLDWEWCVHGAHASQERSIDETGQLQPLNSRPLAPRSGCGIIQGSGGVMMP